MIAVGPGVKQTVTERGPWADHKTACRFAVEAQIDLRMGYRVSVDPTTPDNFVHDLQLAGDNTPQNGSTMRQGQKAQAALLPGSPMLFGTMSDAEMVDAVNHGATVGFAVNCGKLPHYLKNFVGFGYNGGHYMAVDAAYPDGTVDLSDSMYRPARAAKPRRVPWSDVAPAVERSKGDMVVTLGYEDAAYNKQQLDEAKAEVADLQAQVAALDGQLADAEDKITNAKAALA